MSWLDALGWAGSVLLIVSLMQGGVLRFRALNLVASLVLTIFNLLLEIWPMVAMNAVLCLINLYFLRRLLSERHDEEVFEVVEVGPDDAYLCHVLTVEREGIAKSQPGFGWDPQGPGQRAFLVLRGAETVGVVLLRDAGDGVAEIVLDYVTARFRDFSPGEFVWRRSAVLSGSGFTRVLSPAGMVGAYYHRVGFHREGDRYALDL